MNVVFPAPFGPEQPGDAVADVDVEPVDGHGRPVALRDAARETTGASSSFSSGTGIEPIFAPPPERTDAEARTGYSSPACTTPFS